MFESVYFNDLVSFPSFGGEVPSTSIIFEQGESQTKTCGVAISGKSG